MIKFKRHHNERSRGFVLIEVLMCISIMSFFMVPLVGIYYDSIKTIRASGIRHEALNIAQRHAENILAMKKNDAFTMYCGYEEMEGEYVVCVDLDFENSKSLAKATIRVYLRGTIEAEIVTYKSMG